MKSLFFHGILAGILASIASLSYNAIYSSAMLVDFSVLINPMSIIGSCLFGTLLISLGHHFFSKWVKKHAEAVFNLLLLSVTFALMLNVFLLDLPLEMESPELFIGLSVPMHIFPALFWLGSKPLFGEKAQVDG